MIVVVNDTNIFIDLYKTSLLDAFFQLPYEFHTVDFVIHEIENNEQKQAVNQHIEGKKLFVKTFVAQELATIQQIKSQAGHHLSFTDCAVWHYAHENRFSLLTGDNPLRTYALAAGTSVHGILFVFDQLVEHAIISKKEATEKAEILLRINPRLPRSIFLDRIERWRGGE